MISTTQREATDLHPLARFVTKEGIALLLKLKPEEIYRIDCWRYVIHIVGKGVSTFISYADLPPILGVEPPTNQDFVRWRKRSSEQQTASPRVLGRVLQAKILASCFRHRTARLGGTDADD